MSKFDEYKVEVSAFDVVFVSARNDKEALAKAKKKLGKKMSYHVVTRQKCAGTWDKNCKNFVEWFDAEHGETECRTCQYDREQDRINTPG